ncbi:MAG: tRNA lysidine(34) synthetase TilS [Treponema sp.]|nr:tRNA lysidine(34) synthetase TilS [Treponema sp.]
MENFRAGFEERLDAALVRGAPDGRVFLAALSGGADSTALAAALAAVRDSRKTFELRCLHVNHNIRGREECFRDEQHVISLCGKISVPLRVHRVKPGAVKSYARVYGTGLEAAARYFRHVALRKEALRTGAGAILIAHTRDDLLETVLMAVLRGAGPAGLGAMAGPGAAAGPDGPAIPIVRPLLGTTREEVIRYLSGRGIPYTTDPSNDDPKFLRNRIRKFLVPLLDREFPHWRTPLLSLNEQQAGIAGFLSSLAARGLPWTDGGGGLFLDAQDFFAQDPVIREEALFKALDALSAAEMEPGAGQCGREPENGRRAVPGGGGFRPRRAALKPFVSGEKAACDLGAFRLEKKGGRITVKARPPSVSQNMFSVLIKNPGVCKLEKLTLRSFREPLPDLSEGSPPGSSSCGFFASFPLVLRSMERKEYPAIEVRDREGRAAIVSIQGEIKWSRKGRNGFYIVPCYGG